MYSLILVDDEKTVLDNLTKAVDWSAEGFTFSGSFSSAVQALEYMKTHSVDLVITDIKMPVMDGVDFAKTIQKFYPNTFVIVLSAYREFEYVQKCMEFDVIEYVLKPITFLKIKNALKSAKTKLNQRIIFSDEAGIKKRKLFFDIMRGNISNISAAISEFKSNNINIDVKKSKFILFRVKIANFENFIENTWPHSTQQFYNAFSNILVLDEKNISEFMLGYDYVDLFLVLTCEYEHMFLKSLYDVFSCISNKCFELLSLEIDIEILNIYSNIEEFFGAANHQSIETSSINGIIVNIKEGKIFDAQEKIEAIFKYNIQPAKYYCNFLQALIIELSKIIDISNESENKLFVVCEKYASIDEIKKQLLEIIDYSTKILNTRPDNQQILIENAKNYIKDNYSEDLLLANIAKAVFVSESHLSRVFKQKTGESIVDYINRIRLNHAKEMLISSDLSIDDICSRCGYKSKTLFYKYFKQMFEFPPNKYKSMVLNKKNT